MKRFLIRAGAKVGHFFWSWGFLKFILWTVTIIVLFYAEEDWRGARAWAATKAEWEAKGESFDLNRLISPPVPDNENLAALPLFKVEPDSNPKNKSNFAPLALERALRRHQPGNGVDMGYGQEGELPEMKKIREIVASDYLEAFKTAPPSNDALAQFDALYPFVDDLRSASAMRPFCRFPLDYSLQPFNDLRIITDQLSVAQALKFHAVLALDAHKSDLALEDIKTTFKLISGLRQEPLLVSGLVAMGMTAIIGKGTIYDGLAFHSWDDAQLADLQNELAKTDFLSDYQYILRGDMSIMTSTYDHFKSNRSSLWPAGWSDLIKIRAVNYHLNAIGFVDPKARLVFSKAVDQFATGVAQGQRRWDAYTLWGILSAQAAGSIVNTVMNSARIQIWVDEARIACALERYRLAHGVYPDSLDALAPACIDKLPHDVMNGQPYHYHLRADGAYLLYSVGWNQTDDGGKIAYKKESPYQIDYTQGDWAWPTPKYSKAN